MSKAHKDKPIVPRQAWQPFTPRGVAAYSRSSFTRLLFVQLVVAAFVALVILWFMAVQWFPVVEQSIAAVSGTNVIRNGFLATTNSSPVRLGGNRSLEITIDPRDAGSGSSAADLSLIFTARELQVCGVLGCVDVPYQRGYLIELSRASLEPWWQAWRKPMVALVALGTIASLLVSWWVLGLLAAPCIKLFAFFTDRHVTFGGSWRLGMASLLPGAFIVSFGVALYTLEAIDVLRFGLVYLLHFVCGLAFLVTSPFFLARKTSNVANPFGGHPDDKADEKPRAPDTNPFARNG